MEDLLHFPVALAVIIHLNHISLPMEVLQILIWASGKSHRQGYIRCLLLHAWFNGKPLMHQAATKVEYEKDQHAQCPVGDESATVLHALVFVVSWLVATTGLYLA